MSKKSKKRQQLESAGTRRDAAGRLHLALHRDPVSGREGIALEVPVFEESWQNDLAAL